MTTLILESIDDQTLGLLESSARLHRRTVEAEALDLIRQGASQVARREALVRRANDIASMTPKDIKQTDSVQLLRKDRSR